MPATALSGKAEMSIMTSAAAALSKTKMSTLTPATVLSGKANNYRNNY